MSIDLRLPKINGETQKEQISQMKSFLYQLVKELNWALNIPKETTTEETTSTDAKEIFESIKPYIKNSSEIVDAFYYAIKSKYNDDLELVYGSIKDYALNARVGITNIKIDDSVTTDIPDGISAPCFGIIRKTEYTHNGVTKAVLMIELVSWTGEMAICSYSEFTEQWYAWRYITPTES